MEPTKVTVTVLVESPLGDTEEVTLELNLTTRIAASAPGIAARQAVAKVMEALGAYR